jgi:cytochrome d ubiquinol oxidase subunit I
MEGMFAFFLESTFLGLFVFGEKWLGQKGHYVTALLMFLGSWLSGYFIVVTNAWMQNPVAYVQGADGSVHLNSFWGLLTNPWALWQYVHTMAGAVVTAAFVMASVGSYYLLSGKDAEYGGIFVRTGLIAGILATLLVIFPSGDGQGKNIARYQPVTLAAMEGLYRTQEGAPLVMIGQPDMQKLTLDNPLHVPKLLSFLTYYRWNAEVKGLDAFPRDVWPDNIPLLYYSYHIMVGLGTIFLAVLLVGVVLLRTRRLQKARPYLWILMLSFPFPYIANTAGWMTTELGRQPWLVYNLLRTPYGMSSTVSAGNGLFTLLGFLGLYFVLGVLFLFLVIKIISDGPSAHPRPETGAHG